MNLLLKVLRSHLSIGQTVGFFIANVFGLAVIMLAVQAYSDVSQIFRQPDSFLSNDYIVLSKKVSALQAIGIGNSDFSDREADDLAAQPFVVSLGRFTSANYRISGTFGMGGMSMSSYLFFESVPDKFLDVDSRGWKFEPGSSTIPIIIPRNYLNLYNYGFSRSQGLPQISQELFNLVEFDLQLSGNGRSDNYKGKIVGFSNRLNTVLVPQEFMDWSNGLYGNSSKTGASRLILEVRNTADKQMHTYLSKNGYEIEGDGHDGDKSGYFLRLATTGVVAIGLVITMLSLFILILSIYLLLQKNTEKLRNLILLGFTPGQVSMPFKLLTISLVAASFLLALILVVVARSQYMPELSALVTVQPGSILPALFTGLGVTAASCALNSILISTKVKSLWNHG